MADLKYYDGTQWITLKGPGVDLTSAVGVDTTDCDIGPADSTGSLTKDGAEVDGVQSYKLDLNLPRPPVVTTSETEPTDACDGDFWVDEMAVLKVKSGDEWVPVAGGGGGGHVKAFVNFNGADANPNFTLENGGIRKSFNISSVTDLGTGHYDINFETSFPDNEYVWSGNAGGFDEPAAYATPIGMRTGTVTPDKIRMMTPFCYISKSNINSSNSDLADYTNVCVTIVGDYP